jgi:hypothetical protein
MKFVETMSHGFARWESPDGKESFNIEGTGEGLSKRTDEFYKNWPEPVSDKIISERHYLQSMTPLQELSAFLRARVTTLKVSNRLPEAWDAALAAQRLAPELDQNRISIAELYRLRNPGLEGGLQQSRDMPLQKGVNSSDSSDPNVEYIGLSPEIVKLLPPDVLCSLPRRPNPLSPDPTPINPTPSPSLPYYGPASPLPPSLAGLPMMPSFPSPYPQPNMPNGLPPVPGSGSFNPNSSPYPAPFNPNAPYP